MEKLKAAFMFIAPEVDSKKHKATISIPAVELHIVGVKNYNEAYKVAKNL